MPSNESGQQMKTCTSSELKKKNNTYDISVVYDRTGLLRSGPDRTGPPNFTGPDRTGPDPPDMYLKRKLFLKAIK